ncbi:MAG: hypothetical protein EAZ06_10155 [Cytophagales bacterium]|nr:MAG: hypothetical protein EAZ06_10155 [Cytophagales bacterium]
MLAQQLKIRQLQQIIDYYPNGNIKTIKNLVLGKCCMFIEEFGDYMILDTCYYGLFKEYYPNGIIKISGQYDCRFWDKDYKLQDKTNKINLQNDCFKTGVWQEFDSLGKQIKTSLYDAEGYLVFHKYPSKKDTLEVRDDSVMLKLKNYDIKNSYLIRRYKNNKKLFIKFPMPSDHNYVIVFQKPMATLFGSKVKGPEDIYKYLKGIKGIKSDDLPKNNTDFMNFSDLKSGIYYVQYYSNIMNIYELEIILEDVDE